MILAAWLPKYADALTYMALMFPLCVFESKTSMLVTTYLKILRKEKWILLINVSTVGLSVVTTAITVFWLKNLTLAVLSIVVLQSFRCIFGELLLSRNLDIAVKKDIILEVVMTAIFISVSWFIRSWWCMALYALAYAGYLLIKRRDLREMLHQVKLSQALKVGIWFTLPAEQTVPGRLKRTQRGRISKRYPPSAETNRGKDRIPIFPAAFVQILRIDGLRRRTGS